MWRQSTRFWRVSHIFSVKVNSDPEGTCVAMLSGDESFSPDDASDSALDSVMPMKGKYTIIYTVLALRCRVVVKVSSLVMLTVVVHATALCRITPSISFCTKESFVQCSVGESFSPGGAYEFAWDSVKPMKGYTLLYYFQYQDVVGCVCMLKDWISSCCVFCRRLPQLLPVHVEGYGSRCSLCSFTGIWSVGRQLSSHSCTWWSMSRLRGA